MCKESVMSKVSMWVKLPLQPGTRDAAVAAIQVALDNVQGEQGTEIYIVHADPNDADVVYFYEKYADADALGAHGGSEWFKGFGPTLAPFLAGRPEMLMLTPLAGKGF
jgi:quinol monooxygenase YgiN